MKRPTVAVCIPTYNQAQFLEEAVLSALRQTYAPVEVWISDDGSTDNTAEVGAKLAERHPRVHYFRQSKNVGVCQNNNWVLSQPRTDYIVRLDSDDLLGDQYIERVLPLMEKWPSAAFAHVAVNEIDETGRFRRVRSLARTEEVQSADDALRASVVGYRVAANICTFRASALQASGNYRTGIDFCEDWDLSVRFADAGWGNIYCPEILASYRVWSDGARVAARRKATEIKACTTIFETSLTPAFERRGWDTAPILESRRRFALGHTIALDTPSFSEADRQHLTQLLQELGDSRALRWRLALIERGFGSWFRRSTAARVAAKDAVKYFLRRTVSKAAA